MSQAIKFTPSAPLTLGVELELQLIDPETFDLAPRAIEVLAAIGEHPNIVPEVMQSMVEIKTGICQDAHQAQRELAEHLSTLRKAAGGLGLHLACSGTHPFAKHWERKVFPLPRYQELIDRNQFISRRLIIFGMHVHIGVESGAQCIALMNEMNHELPLLLALSASSPFWEGIETGLASSRTTIFEAIPTGGHPCQMHSWGDFENLVHVLTKARSIRSLKDVWWDLRPSPDYGTLEIRICDGMPALRENTALVAFIHCLAAYHLARIKAGETRPHLPDWWMRENKWRASRHGVEADLIVSCEGVNASVPDLVKLWMGRLRPYIDQHGYDDFCETMTSLAEGNTSYRRQRQAYEANGDIRDVARHLVGEMTPDV